MISRCFVCLGLLLLTSSLEAGSELLRINHNDVPNTEVRVDSVFGAASQHGSLPFRVTIRNNSGEDRVWTVRIRESGYGRPLATGWSGKIPVANGSEISQEVILPFSPNFAGSTYRNLEVIFTTPGLNVISRSTGYQLNGNFPTLALSSTLATRSLAKLDGLVTKKNSSNRRFGESFEIDALSGDWKAYTGLDALLVDQKDWKMIPGRSKRALLEWVRLGGLVHIYYDRKTDPQFSLDQLEVEGLVPVPGKNKQARLSLGMLELKSWDGTELANHLHREYEGVKRNGQRLDNEYRNGWDLSNRLGDKPFNSLLIFCILFIFAILVAPVNLFYFAKHGQRHRLFYTTPLISIGACLVIVVLIFLGDGLGGKGYRAAFVELQSGDAERRFYISQEQFSRTGVVVNTGFTNEKDLIIEPFRVRESVYAAFNRRTGRSTTFNFGSNNYSGGFFRSRSEQGFLLKAVEPTRARIEQRGSNDDGPTLVSNLPTAVSEFFYFDETGQVWKTAGKAQTNPGDTFSLKPGTNEEFEEFLSDRVERFGPTLRDAVSLTIRERNRFYATSVDTTPYLIETHAGIEWSDDFLLLSGTVSQLNTSAL